MNNFLIKAHLILLVLLTAFRLDVEGQAISAIAKVDTNAIKIGGQTRLSISVTAASEYKVRIPVLKDSIQKIEIIEKIKSDTTYSQDKKYTTYTDSYTITCFDSGYKAIPPFEIIYNSNTDTAKKVWSTEAFLLRVNGIQIDTTKEIRPIKAPLEVPYSLIDFIVDNKYYSIGLIGILLIGFLLFYFLKNRKSKPQPQVPSKPLVPAHEMALVALKELEQKKLWQNGENKLYQSMLSDIVRTYIENKFSINAMEFTTYETISVLSRLNKFSKEQIQILNQLLELSDMVKFAKQQPLPYENELSMKNAYQFINETTSII